MYGPIRNRTFTMGIGTSTTVPTIYHPYDLKYDNNSTSHWDVANDSYAYYSNDTTNVTTVPTNKIIENIYVQVTFCVLYVAIFTIGVFGNVLVCYVVLRNKAMQTVTNLFITNLALSDILLCVLAVPFTPLYTFLGRWVFGRALCHLLSYSQGCSVYISTLTLTSIAVDRYFVIIYPFRPRMKLSTCILIITSIWIVSLVMTLPYGMYMFVYLGEDGDKWYCEENWPEGVSRKVYSSVTTILQFVLPFLIITACYTLVSNKLNERAKSKPGSKTSKKEEADRDRKRRTNRMLISMVSVFGISWLPLNLNNIVLDFYDATGDFLNLLFFIAHCIAMSSTCYNPFLYAWLNENFRKEFKLVLPCLFQRSSTFNSSMYNRGACRSDRTFCNGHDGQDKLLPTGGNKGAVATAIDDPIDIHAKKNTDTMPMIDGPINGYDSTKILASGMLETPFDYIEEIENGVNGDRNITDTNR